MEAFVHCTRNRPPTFDLSAPSGSVSFFAGLSIIWVTHRTGENRTSESRPVSLNFHDFSLLDGIVHMYTGTCLIEKWHCETSGQRKNWLSGYVHAA